MVFSMTDKYAHWNGGSRVSAGINNTGSPRNILEHSQIIWELEGAHIQYPGLEHCAPAQTNCHSFALLVESLLELNRVKDVNFNHNALPAACCASLAELLQFSPLEALHLNDVGFNADALLMLADGINHAKALRLIDLTSNLFAGGGGLLQYFGASAHNLTSLTVASCRMDAYDSCQLLLGLKAALKLEYLNISDNCLSVGSDEDGADFQPVGGDLLADSISSWSSLRTLNISDCFLFPTSLAKIFKLLAAHAQQLQQLSAADNDWSPALSSLLTEIGTQWATQCLTECEIKDDE
ncbi:hypothetical protein MP228_009989 [Amoeboaphelidium protococcarum]|nr:hypothetical protein MP228_009989 [Amoeboaphelidium protococcarum]